MNAMVSMLVLLFIGQTVAFDLSKIWLPDDMTLESKFDIHVWAPAEIFVKGWEYPKKDPHIDYTAPVRKKCTPIKRKNIPHTKKKAPP